MMTFKSVLAVYLLFFTFVMPVHAEDPELDTELGPAVGSMIPHQLDVNGQPAFGDLTGKNGLVLFFVRSVDWCPFCKNQVTDVSARLEEFEARGLAVAYLSYDIPEKQVRFQTQKNINGAFISDPASEVIDAFGLRNTNHQEGSFGYGIPHPVVFIFDHAGQIKTNLYEDDYRSDRKSYRNRPAVNIILGKADQALSAVF